MAEYLIREETLTEIADIVREKFEYYDMSVNLVSNRDNLTNLVIPDSVTSIGDSAFVNCTRLTSITIPDSVTSIGSDAFYCCTRLTSITIPKSVTSIGSYAFSYCTSLKSVTIPDSVTSIGSSGTFWNCTSLTSITIPNSVTSIGYNAFSGCNNLTDMYLHPITPPTLNFTNAISTATTAIHVPAGSGDAYKSATNWSAFADIIVEDIVI